MIQIQTFSLLTQNVSIMRHINVSGVAFLPILQKKSSSKEEKLRLLFSFHLFYLHNTSNTIGSLRNFDSLKEC